MGTNEMYAVTHEVILYDVQWHSFAPFLTLKTPKSCALPILNTIVWTQHTDAALQGNILKALLRYCLMVHLAGEEALHKAHGINAALWLEGKEPFIPFARSIHCSLMIRDKGTNEPYRMMTSRRNTGSLSSRMRYAALPSKSPERWSLQITATAAIGMELLRNTIVDPSKETRLAWKLGHSLSNRHPCIWFGKT